MPLLNIISVNQRHIQKVREAKATTAHTQKVSPLFFNSFMLWNKYIKEEVKKAGKHPASQSLQIINHW